MKSDFQFKRCMGHKKKTFSVGFQLTAILQNSGFTNVQYTFFHLAMPNFNTFLKIK
jgi:hypothetical protein